MKCEDEHGAVKEKTQAITHSNKSSQTNTNAIKEARISRGFFGFTLSNLKLVKVITSLITGMINEAM